MNDIQIRKGKKKKNQIKGEKMTTRVAEKSWTCISGTHTTE